MALTTALIVGGIAVLRSKTADDDSPQPNRLTTLRSTLTEKLQGLRRNKRQTQLATLINDSDDVAVTATERRLNRDLIFSGASLAVTVVGTIIYPPLRLLSLPSLVYILIPIYRDAYRSAHAKQFDVNVLYAITQSLVVGRGYLLPANLGAFYYFLSRKLLVMAEDRFAVQLHTIFGQLPTTVHRLVDGVEVACPLAEIAAGDLKNSYESNRHII